MRGLFMPKIELQGLELELKGQKGRRHTRTEPGKKQDL
jgi:hypothetical protein